MIAVMENDQQNPEASVDSYKMPNVKVTNVVEFESIPGPKGDEMRYASSAAHELFAYQQKHPDAILRLVQPEAVQGGLRVHVSPQPGDGPASLVRALHRQSEHVDAICRQLAKGRGRY